MMTEKLLKLEKFLQENEMEIISTEIRGLIYYDKETQQYYRQIHDGISELHTVERIPYEIENILCKCDEYGKVW